MNQNTPKYNRWKVEMKNLLDELVAQNFERIYNSHDAERAEIWGGISSELYQKYDLIGISSEDPSYELKCKMQHCIFINRRIYAEKEFPWELDNERTYRFVKKYGKLPKQAPEEWRNFEHEQKLEEIRQQHEADRKLDEYLEATVAAHPEYAYR